MNLTDNLVTKMTNSGYELTYEFTNALETMLNEFPNQDEANEFLYSLGQAINATYGDAAYNR